MTVTLKLGPKPPEPEDFPVACVFSTSRRGYCHYMTLLPQGWLIANVQMLFRRLGLMSMK